MADGVIQAGVPTGAVSLQQLVRTFVKKTHDSLQDMLESLEAEHSDVLKRRQLLRWFESRRQQLVRLLVIVKWLKTANKHVDKVQAVLQVLDARDSAFQTAVHAVKLMSRRVEERLYPVWDVSTALHVMTSGSYRLLPKVIETEVQFATRIPPELIASTLSRLNDQLHMRLLSTPIPPAFSRVRVSNGMAYLTVPNEFEVGVSLRMTVQENPPKPESERIKWTLFELRVLCGVRPHTLLPDAHTHGDRGRRRSKARAAEADSDDDEPDRALALTTATATATATDDSDDAAAAPQPLVSAGQIAALLDYCNRLCYHAPHQSAVLQVLYDRLHAFVVHTTMDVCAAQSRAVVARLTPLNCTVTYAKHHKLVVSYWPHAPAIPVPGHARARQIGLVASLSSVASSSAAAAAAAAATASVAGGGGALSRLLLPSAVRLEEEEKALADRERSRREPIALTIWLDDSKQLSVRCHPPLPAMESAADAEEHELPLHSAELSAEQRAAARRRIRRRARARARFALDTSDVDLLRLSGTVLREHANERVAALYEYLVAAEADEQSEVSERRRAHFLHSSAAAPNAPAVSGNGNGDGAAVCYEQLELVNATDGSGAVLLRVVLVRDHHALLIRTDLQTGRFVFAFERSDACAHVRGSEFSAALTWLQQRVNSEQSRGGGLQELRPLLGQLRVQCTMGDVRALVQSAFPLVPAVSQPALLWTTAVPNPFGAHCVFVRVPHFPAFLLAVDSHSHTASTSDEPPATRIARAIASDNVLELLTGSCASFYLVQTQVHGVSQTAAQANDAAARNARTAAANRRGGATVGVGAGRGAPSPGAAANVSSLGGSALQTTITISAPTPPAGSPAAAASASASALSTPTPTPAVNAVVTCVRLPLPEVLKNVDVTGSGSSANVTASGSRAHSGSVTALHAILRHCQRLAPACLLAAQLSALRLPVIPAPVTATTSSSASAGAAAAATAMFAFASPLTSFLTTRFHSQFVRVPRPPAPVAGAPPPTPAQTVPFHVTVALRFADATQPDARGWEVTVSHPLFARVSHLLTPCDAPVIAPFLTAAVGEEVNAPADADGKGSCSSSGCGDGVCVAGGSPDSVVFRYSSIGAGSVDWWLRELTGVLALFDIALTLDDHNARPQAITNSASLPGGVLPAGFFHARALSVRRRDQRLLLGVAANASASVNRLLSHVLVSRHAPPLVQPLSADLKQSAARVTITPFAASIAAVPPAIVRWPQRAVVESAWNTNGGLIHAAGAAAAAAAAAALASGPAGVIASAGSTAAAAALGGGSATQQPLTGWLAIAQVLYWSHAALHPLSTFVNACAALDAQLSASHAVFGAATPSVAPAPAAGAGARNPAVGPYGAAAATLAVPTVVMSAESASRVRLSYRQSASTRLDVRLLNAAVVTLTSAAAAPPSAVPDVKESLLTPSASAKPVTWRVPASELSRELWLWYRRCAQREWLSRAHELTTATAKAIAVAAAVPVSGPIAVPPYLRIAFRAAPAPGSSATAGDDDAWRRPPLELVVLDGRAAPPTPPLATPSVGLGAPPSPSGVREVDAPRRQALLTYFAERVCAPPYNATRLTNFYRLLCTPKGEFADLCDLMAVELETHRARGGGPAVGSRVRLCLELTAPLDVQYTREHDIVYFVLQFTDAAPVPAAPAPAAASASSASSAATAGAGAGGAGSGAGSSSSLFVALAFYWPDSHLGLWRLDGVKNKSPQRKVPIVIPPSHPLHARYVTSAGGPTTAAGAVRDSLPLVPSIRYLASLPFAELSAMLNALQTA